MRKYITSARGHTRASKRSIIFKVRGAKYLVVHRHGNAHWSLVTSLTAACTSIDENKLLE